LYSLLFQSGVYTPGIQGQRSYHIHQEEKSSQASGATENFLFNNVVKQRSEEHSIHTATFRDASWGIRDLNYYSMLR
jgi:hypothetical protein